MKIQVISDTHFEFHKDHGVSFIKDTPVVGDILVLAGDILPVNYWKVSESVSVLKGFTDKFPHVIYVPGNHDHWGDTIKNTQDRIFQIAEEFDNFHYLYRGKSLSLDGFHFIGDTCWTPNSPLNPQFEGLTNDFRKIKCSKDIYEENDLFSHYLAHTLHEGDVVITHHLPSFLSVPAKFKTSETNRFFVSDFSKLILERNPKLWIHGHTHEACNYKLGNTRIVANPLGYPNERSNFRDGFVVQV